MPDDLTPAQREAVRRMLADARATDPMPADVAGRLDAVVAELAAARAAGTGEGEPLAAVLPLHRRRWPQVLVAAAAVSLLGLVGTQLLGPEPADDLRAGNDTAASAPEPGPRELGDDLTSFEPEGGRDSADEEAPGAPLERDASDQRGEALQDGALSYDGQATTLPGLDRALRAAGDRPVGQLRGTLHRTTARKQLPLSQGYAWTEDSRARFPSLARWRCGPLYAVPGGSTYVSATRPGVLVVAHPAANGLRLVEVYECRGSDPRRSASVVTLTDVE